MEIIICAAVKTVGGEIIRGHRHSDCIHRATMNKRTIETQGFITSQNRFVDRKEAYEIHKAAGGETDKLSDQLKELFSEDVY